MNAGNNLFCGYHCFTAMTKTVISGGLEYLPHPCCNSVENAVFSPEFVITQKIFALNFKVESSFLRLLLLDRNKYLRKVSRCIVNNRIQNPLRNAVCDVILKIL